MQEVVIASAARTAVGSYGKSLKDIPTTDLGATAVTAAMERAGIEPEQVEQVVFGNVIHSAPEDMYMARVVGIKAGIPKETPAFTVNRLCGTGVQAIVSAAQTIQTGEADVVVAGGAESMSRGPYWMPNVRWGARMGEAKMVDPVVGGLTDPFHRVHMGITAENLAESHDISREQQDEFALESHRRAHAAQEAGKFDDEVVPGRGEGEEGEGAVHPRRARAAGGVDGVDGEAEARLQAGRHRHGRQRLGHERRGRGRRADVGREGGGAGRARCAAGSCPTPTAASTRRRWASARCRPRARRSTRRACRSTTST